MFNDPDPDPEYSSPSSLISPPRRDPPHTRTHPPIPPPSCSIRLLLIVTQVPAHASDDSNNTPTTINPPLGAVNVPINTQDQATALVQILHVIRSTRGHALADWAPKGQTAQRNPCLDHQTRAATNCPDCWSEVKTGMRPAELVGKHRPIPDTLETAMSRKDTP